MYKKKNKQPEGGSDNYQHPSPHAITRPQPPGVCVCYRTFQMIKNDGKATMPHQRYIIGNRKLVICKPNVSSFLLSGLDRAVRGV